ncbi:MAG TPA: hypothetical protein DCQ06_01420 [Myxococcales bacterium]|nr:hypothetical protein [Myxococcales bacterium]
MPRIQSEADERAFLEQAVRWWDQAEQFHWLIFTKDTYTYLGMVGGHDLQWTNAVAEIGYWLTSDGVGHGYMTEAVRAIEQCLFQMGFFRVEIQCAALNTRSAAVAHRLGYKPEGRLRSNRSHDGLRDDTLVFGRLASDA